MSSKYCNLRICKEPNLLPSLFGVNSQKDRQKPPKSPVGGIATRHQAKFCWKLNFMWKNGITQENRSTQTKIRKVQKSSLFQKKADFGRTLTLDCNDRFSFMIPFFHLELNFQQNFAWWRVAISPIGDFGGFLWRFLNTLLLLT